MAALDDTAAPEASLRVGVNVAGYFDSTLGVGEAARQVLAALRAAGVPTAALTLPERRSRKAAPQRPPAEPPFETTLICANADGLEGARDWLGPGYLRGRTIGLWWWEVERFPDRWRRAFDGLDELWVGSRFVADAIAPVSPVPVLAMPLPVARGEPASLTRAQLELPEGFLFLFVFDFASGFERKNPLGAIEAFIRAFPPGSGATLAIKHIGEEGHAAESAHLAEAAARHPDVHLLGGYLPPERHAALTAACDCYVSLHRSEGFGLTIAEAVLAGKPVVATAYSGPLDYLDASTAFLVSQELRAVGPGNEPYPADARWADPDLDQAGRLMRDVRADAHGARARAERACERLARSHGPLAAGGAMARRLARLERLPVDGAGRIDGIDLSELDRRIGAAPPLPPATRRNPLRRALRQAVLRLLRPQTVHQRRVDEELARTMRTLDERVQGLASAQAGLAAQLEALRSRSEGRPGGG